MTPNPSRRSLALAALALAGLACTCPIGALVRDLRQPTAAAAPTAVPPQATSAPSADPVDPGPAPTAVPGISEAVAAQMSTIESEVVRLRGLQPTGPVQRALLSPEQLRQHVLDDFLADYSQAEAEDEARTLALLGLLSPGYDMYRLYLDLYSEQIAGFYDDDDKQMYVVQGTGFGGAERVTHAHEYTHALQDQRWGLSEGLGYNDEDCEADSEHCAGVQALIEGDATLLEQQWLLTYATQQDWDDINRFYDSYQSPVFDSAPQFLQQDFLFPYDFGYAFVNLLFLRGGWAAVDAVYADPPSSTEQILHPDRYPRDRPVRLQVPDLLPALGEGWREVDRDVLGEWYTRLVLQEQLEAAQAEPAAQGWGGDYYLVFHQESGDQSALVLLTQWDSLGEAYEFLPAFRQYGDARFGGRLISETTQTTWDEREGFASIEVRGEQTLWVLAPDAETAARLRQAVQFPAEAER
jgi:hypothetical protein